MITLFVVLTLVTVPTLGDRNTILPQKSEDVLKSCITEAVSEYFDGENVAYFFDSSSKRLVPKILDQVVIDTNYKTSLNIPFSNVVFFVNKSSFGVDKHFDYLKNNNLWHMSNGPRQKYLVIVEQGVSLAKISEIFLRHDIHIFAIISHDPIGRLQIYQSRGHFCKQESQLIHLGACGAKFKKQESNIFTNCRIKVLILHKDNAFPFVRNLTSNQPGLYVEILRVLPKIGNFSISYMMAPRKDTTKYIQNGKTDLFEALLSQGNIDIFAAAYSLRTAKFLSKMDTSNIFYDANMLWIVPKKIQIPFEVILNLIDFKLKVATAFLVLICFLICYIIEKKCSRIFWFLGTLFENTSRVPWKFHSIKMTIAFFLMFSLIFGLIYKAKLSSILSESVFDNGLETLEDLVDSNLTLFVKQTSKNDFKNIIQSDPLAKNMYYKMQSAPPTLYYDDIFKTLVKYKNVSTTIDEIMWNVVKKKVKGSLYIIKPPNYLIPRKSVFVLRKGHPLLRLLNLVIDILTESGVMAKFIGEVYHPQISTDIGLDKNEEVTALTLEHLEGAFYIYLMMIAVSFLAFLCEIVLYKLIVLF